MGSAGDLGVEELNGSKADLAQSIALKADSWEQVFEFLRLEERTAIVERVTAETNIRIELDLYANIRPARTRAGVSSVAEHMDVVVVRENTEGFYSDRNMFEGIAEFRQVNFSDRSTSLVRDASTTLFCMDVSMSYSHVSKMAGELAESYSVAAEPAFLALPFIMNTFLVNTKN